jgi:hypothetical protein
MVKFKSKMVEIDAVRVMVARRLMDDTPLPLDWNEQRQALGFAPVV